MRQKRAELDWKPVRRGSIYCAPGCGRGCTWVEYRRAVKRAEEMVALLGPGWEPVVTENLGWFCHVRNGNLAVFWYTGGTYFAALSDDGGVGTPAYWHKSESFKNPRDAVESQVLRARAFVQRAAAIVTEAEKVIKEW